SRTSPCKTWAGAISKTAAGGEIDALDPGGFGTLTITKSIVVDGTNGQGFGSTLNSGGVNGFTVNDSLTAAPNTTVVRLRNLSINGAGTTLGLNGIRFVAGAQLSVENCRIMNQSGDGISVASGPLNATNGAMKLVVRDTIISDCASDAIEMAGTATANSAVSVSNSILTRNGNGFRVTGRASATIVYSVISLNNTTAASKGVEAASATSGGSIIDLVNTDVSYNSIGVSPNTNQAIRLSGVHMTGNANALNFAGGTIATLKNNSIVGNTAGEVFASLTPVNQQ
ncbi:MAG TPA: hypothetical protein VF508_07200, partial [Pyrinomonadaceae bacterium]